jgi:tetratricopeptide (TPR) repeat protein
MKFSIGYNYNTKTLDLLDIYRDNIEAVYFPMPQKYFASGRSIKEPVSYLKEIPSIIKKCAFYNIKPQLLLNGTCESQSKLNNAFLGQILDYIKQLRDIGLKSVVVTNPIYIVKIKKHVSDITVESSVNCYVKTVEHALYLKDLGVDVLTIDRDINRDIPLIRDIKNKTNLKIRIMLNEGCVSNCPYRVVHYNYISGGLKLSAKKIGEVFWDRFCVAIYLNNPGKVFRIPFIPPENLSYYGQFTDYYKLSTRTFTTDRIELCLKAYINRHFSGNLLSILDCPGLSYFEYIDYDIIKRNNFFSNMLNCKVNCITCNYCNELLKKAVLINRCFQDKRDEGEERKALRVYKRVLKHSYNNDNRIQAYLQIGEACLRLNKFEEAIKNIKKVLKSSYKVSWAYLLLGLCYERLENYKQAINVLRRVEEASPQNREADLVLMRCYRKIGKTAMLNNKISKITRGFAVR